MNSTIKHACFATGPNYASKTSGELAELISQPVAFQPFSDLTEFFVVIKSTDANIAEFKAAWRGDYLQRVEKAITAGNLDGTLALLDAGPVEFTSETYQAILSVIQFRYVRLIDTVATETVSIEAITAQNVETALNEVGYTWNGTQWIYNEG